MTEAPADDGTAAPDGRHRSARAPKPRATTRPICETPTPVKLQLQWFVQAQFAGYFAAVDQELLPRRMPRSRDPRRRRRHRPAAAVRRRRGRLRDRLGAQGTPDPRGRCRHRQHRPDLPAFRDAAGVVRRRRHHVARRLRRQEDRELGLRQRVRDLRRPHRGRSRSGNRRRARAAAVRHGRPAGGRHRCRRGDDVQRVRPGAGGREPRHR